MNEEQKRIKLFEATGWKYIEPVKPKSPFITYPKNLPRWKKGRKIVFKDDLPRYFEDLNAVQELEKSLSDGQYDTFEQELARVAGFICHDEWTAPSGLRIVISATAAQRAEAIGRTLNLWT